MTLRRDAIIVGVKTHIHFRSAARLIAGLCFALGGWLLSACSAIELHQQMASQTAAAQTIAAAGPAATLPDGWKM